MSDISLSVKEIPKEVADEAMKAFQSGFTILKPYLQAITTEDRRKLFKMSDGSEPFANKTTEYVQSNPQFIPDFMDVDSLNTGLAVYGQLTPFCSLFSELSSLTCDTRMVAGALVMNQARKYYESVRMAVTNRVAGARMIFEDLRKRFARKKSRKQTGKDAA